MIPVGINYDRTLEDRTLLLDRGATKTPTGTVFALTTTARFIAKNIRLMIGSRWRRLGYASAAFGSPLSMRAYYAANPELLDDQGALQDVEPLGRQLAHSISGIIPVLPVAVMARTLLAYTGTAVNEDTLLTQAGQIVDQCSRREAVIGIPQTTRRYSLATGLEMLVLRKIVARDENAFYRVPETSQKILAYYANAIASVAD